MLSPIGNVDPRRNTYRNRPSLAEVRPDVAERWDTEKNGKLTPWDVTPSSGQISWLIVVECGHSIKGRLKNLIRATGCAVCLGHQILVGCNDFESQRPEQALEWDVERNAPRLPSEVGVFSKQIVWWLCTEHQHSWPTKIATRSQGKGCPTCAGQQVLVGFNDFESQQPEIAAQWDHVRNAPYLPSEFTVGSGNPFWWLCSELHSWETTIYSRTRQHGCPECYVRPSSEVEQALFRAVSPQVDAPQAGAKAPVAWRKNRWADIDVSGSVGGQLVAIEYDGLYFHKGRAARDVDKTVALLDAGYLVVRVREALKDRRLAHLNIQHPNLFQLEHVYVQASEAALDLAMTPTADRIAQWLRERAQQMLALAA